MAFEKGKTPKGAKPFQKGKSGNPKGRPKKLINVIKDIFKVIEGESLKPQLNKQDYEDICKLLAEKTEEQLQNIASDKRTPMFIAIVARAMLKDKAKGTMYAFDNIFDKFIKDDGANDMNVVFMAGLELGINSKHETTKEAEEDDSVEEENETENED
jgi:hypothetical protein